MRLDKFDLNLLVALDALLEERSVTRAAERLNLTQSGVSAALARLRDAFDDPLLVQHGKRMLPTAHAEALHPRIRSAIGDLRALIASTSLFDPSTSTRRFSIAASDYVSPLLLTPLIAEMSRHAPTVRIDVVLPHSAIGTDLANGHLDLLLSPEMYLHDEHPSEMLFEDDYVLAGCETNPLFAAPIGVEDFAAASHIAVSITGKATHFESVFAESGLVRGVVVYTPSFLVAPFLLPGTRHVCVMHGRLARLMAKRLPLAIAPLPFAVPKLRECVQFHEARRADPGLSWLKAELIRLARSI